MSGTENVYPTAHAGGGAVTVAHGAHTGAATARPGGGAVLLACPTCGANTLWPADTADPRAALIPEIAAAIGA